MRGMMDGQYAVILYGRMLLILTTAVVSLGQNGRTSDGAD